MPSGWHHMVENLEDTISINHNWFNGFCLHAVFRFLLAEVEAARQEIAHLREGFIPLTQAEDGTEQQLDRAWEAQVELLVRANAAMNVSEFVALLAARADVCCAAITASRATATAATAICEVDLEDVNRMHEDDGDKSTSRGVAAEGGRDHDCRQWLYSLDASLWRRISESHTAPAVEAASMALRLVQILQVTLDLSDTVAVDHIFPWRAPDSAALSTDDIAPDAEPAREPLRHQHQQLGEKELSTPRQQNTSDGANYSLNNAGHLSRVLQESLAGTGGAVPSGPLRQMVETAIRVLKNNIEFSKEFKAQAQGAM